MNYKHGYTYSKYYFFWKHMHTRCTKPNDPAYKYYGGRGIKVCNEWNDIEIFIFQMKKKYIKTRKKYNNERLSIERINNDYGYHYDNCIFIPQGMQAQNRRYIKPCKAINRKSGKEVYAENQVKLAKKINVSISMVNQVIKGKAKSRKWIIRRFL